MFVKVYFGDKILILPANAKMLIPEMFTFRVNTDDLYLRFTLNILLPYQSKIQITMARIIYKTKYIYLRLVAHYLNN